MSGTLPPADRAWDPFDEPAGDGEPGDSVIAPEGSHGSREHGYVELPEEFLDLFFQNPGDPEGWSSLVIETFARDPSRDPDGEAIKASGRDINEVMEDVAAELGGDSPDGSDLALPEDPERIAKSGRLSVEREAREVLPELENELEEDSARGRAEYDRAIGAARAAGENLADAAIAIRQAALHTNRAVFLSFHSWSIRMWQRSMRSYDAANEWCERNTLAVAVIPVVVSVIISQLS